MLHFSNRCAIIVHITYKMSEKHHTVVRRKSRGCTDMLKTDELIDDLWELMKQVKILNVKKENWKALAGMIKDLYNDI